MNKVFVLTNEYSTTPMEDQWDGDRIMEIISVFETKEDAKKEMNKRLINNYGHMDIKEIDFYPAVVGVL